MQKITIDCWEVTEADGGGMRSNHVAYFSTEAEAQKVANQLQGWRAVNRFTKTFVICNDALDLQHMKVEKERLAALAKLTKRERELLGV